MPAYIIAWLTVKDPEKMDAYRADVSATVKKYGGSYVFSGRGVEALEGDWTAHGMTILEFPTQDDARRWYESPEYAPLIAVREAAADGCLLLTPDADGAH